jgi:amidophosphoribosyltransferase
MRRFNVKVKLNPVRHILNQKRVIIVEDSIIRATTSKMRVKALREAGAWNIHMVVSCPPTIHPCFYGIDFPTEDELIASAKSVEEIKNYVGLDGLSYLSLNGMVEATGLTKQDFCLACFNGKYPVNPQQGISKSYLQM